MGDFSFQASPQLDALLARLHDVRRSSRGFTARCPGHIDTHASLSLTLGDDGRILLYDFAGCPPEAILSALNLDWQALFPEPRRSAVSKSVFVSEYERILNDLIARERRLAERRARWADVMALADELREGDRLVATARGLVDDTDSGWALAEEAADLER